MAAKPIPRKASPVIPNTTQAGYNYMGSYARPNYGPPSGVTPASLVPEVDPAAAPPPGDTGTPGFDMAAYLEEQKNIQRQSAFEAMYATLKEYGIDMTGNGLAATIKGWIWADKSADWIRIEIRKSEPYNKRFTGMAELIKRGQFMNEAQYIQMERDYRAVLKNWDLPKNFYDGPEDFGKFIANGLSVKELDDRVRSAKTFLDTGTDPAYRKALNDAGIPDGSLLAYVLDGNKAQSIITQQMKNAGFAGAANKNGFDVNAQDAARWGATLGQQYDAFGVDQRNQLEATMSDLSVVADNQEKLAQIDNEAYKRNDTLDANIGNDTTKSLASQRRAQREQARFSGSSGFGAGSLSRSSGV